MSFFNELKRRNVFRVAAAYIIVGWLIMQVGDTLAPALHLPEWINSALAFFLILGFPLALFFAWAFEMTPEGIKKQKDIDKDHSITHLTGQKLNNVIIGLLVLALGYFAFDKFVLDPERDAELVSQTQQQAAGLKAEAPPNRPGEKSIAVLPFVNMSADADNEYFSDGISEELLNVLAKISSLHVASRTSAFAFKGKDTSIGEIARQLQVDHVLEGSVRKAGNRVRITAQLIEADSDRHLWSESYERELDDIFEIQAEISNAIVDELKVALNIQEQQAVSRAQRPTDNTEAYEYYLQGRYRWRQRQEENIRAAIDLFEKAIELDPEFAVAHEAMAAAYGSLSAWSAMSRAEALDKAVPHANRALELDPTLSEARAILAEAVGASRQWAEMVRQYELALKYTPNSPTINQWFAEILHNLGYLDRALELALNAYELDPTSPVINNVVTYIAIAAREHDLALKHSRIASDLGVADAADRNLVPLLLERGEIDRLIEMNQWEPAQVPLCVRAHQDASLIPTLLEELRAVDPRDPENNWNERILAMCLAFAGDVGAAVDIYDFIIKEEDWYALNDFWNHTEETIRMRQSDGFKDLVSEVGLADYWREYGWPDLCQPVDEDDFECE